MGTIGLSMADHCRELIGVEIIPEAIDSAKANAARMGACRRRQEPLLLRRCRARPLPSLAAEGLRPDVIMLDPPRKGCDETTLSAVVQHVPPPGGLRQLQPLHRRPRRRVARNSMGIAPRRCSPWICFRGRSMCEAVLLLTKLHVERHIEVDVSMDELDVTAAESKATYNEIRDYVWEHYQLKVSNLYIAQVKQKYGIIERENYHKAKNENAKQPQCPKEKEDAIVEALKHFQMI